MRVIRLFDNLEYFLVNLFSPEWAKLYNPMCIVHASFSSFFFRVFGLCVHNIFHFINCFPSLTINVWYFFIFFSSFIASSVYFVNVKAENKLFRDIFQKKLFTRLFILYNVGMFLNFFFFILCIKAYVHNWTMIMLRVQFPFSAN